LPTIVRVRASVHNYKTPGTVAARLGGCLCHSRVLESMAPRVFLDPAWYVLAGFMARANPRLPVGFRIGKDVGKQHRKRFLAVPPKMIPFQAKQAFAGGGDEQGPLAAHPAMPKEQAGSDVPARCRTCGFCSRGWLGEAEPRAGCWPLHFLEGVHDQPCWR
jgi:hypothetical protein